MAGTKYFLPLIMDLYNKRDNVYILHDSDFIVEQNGLATLKKNVYRGPGLIKAYANWCPHCQDKAPAIKTLGRVINKEHPEYGARIYVFEASSAENTTKAVDEKGEPLLAGFPTMLFVDNGLQVTKLRDQKGEQVYQIPDVLSAMCKTRGQSKMCTLKK